MEENNNFLYKGYLLVITKNSFYYTGECKELNFKRNLTSISDLVDNFERFVNAKLDQPRFIE